MTHNEEYLYKLIKSLQAQLVSLASVNAFILDGGGSGENFLLEGTGDPNTDGIVPADTTKPAFYSQITVDDGVPFRLWTWSVTGQLWY